MKLMILLFVLMLSGVVSAKAQYLISDGKQAVSLEQLAQDLQSYDLVFFGEDHLDKYLHVLQADLLKLLNDGSKPLILSFEMWERDTQASLDQYMAGALDLEEFKTESRAWTNFEDYLPLVDFAAQHQFQAVAANVPRYIASRVAREGVGFIDSLSVQEKSWMAEHITSPDDEYKTKFYAQMTGMGGHGFSEENLWRYYQSQCLKDDTMAESIVNASKDRPEALLIHFNGYFHSNHYLGTVSRVRQALPELKIAVISPLYKEHWEISELSDEHFNLGSHLILLPPYEEE